MALPTVVINSGTGSNTAASGAGPATALSGTAAATAASTIVTLLVDNPDLSGVATDGSAVIWIGSSSGRQFAKITGTNNTAGVKTVTVSDAFANTESGKNWGIGGKRASCAGSSRLFLDFRAGWTIDIQTGETITADIVVTPGSNVAGSPAVIKSTSFTGTWGTQPILQTATSAVAGFDVSSAQNLIIFGLEFKCTFGSPVGGNSGIVPKSGHANFITIAACIFHGWSVGINGVDAAFFRLQNLVVEQCEIYSCTDRGIDMGSNIDPIRMYKCYVHDNTNEGVRCGSGNFASVYHRCVFANNGLAGVQDNTSGSELQVTECGFFGNASSGAQLVGLYLAGGSMSLVLEDNIFWNNGSGAGVSAGIHMTTENSGIIRNNAFGGANQLVTGLDANFAAFNTITLTVDPRTSGTDNLLNSTAGGGALCRNAANPCANASATATNPDIGAIPSGGGAAAGGAVMYHPGMAGGMSS